MSKLFGVDIKGLVNKHVAPGLPRATVVGDQVTGRGAKLTGGQTKTPVTHTCRGIWIDYDNDAVDGVEVKKGDRKALLIGLVVEPTPDMRVTIDGKTQVVVRLESTDPAGATYTVQCRDRTLTPSA